MGYPTFVVRGLLLAALGLHAEILEARTFVTTYVTQVQEERHDTRWTLTEWLRIKERMRLMDVWLAMFSDPRKDAFRPELNLAYSATRGRLTRAGGGAIAEELAVTGAQGRAQLWLTNLISSTVGIRMLNIDLGAEGFQRRSAGTALAGEGRGGSGDLTASSSGSLEPAAARRSLVHTYYTGNLRVFGRNIQDSSLVLKYGEYRSETVAPVEGEVAAASTERRGQVAGAELQVYLLKWLGAEGNVLQFGNGQQVTASERSGLYSDALGFIEVSLLRLMIGSYREVWEYAPEGGSRSRVTEVGGMGGVKLQF